MFKLVLACRRTMHSPITLRRQIASRGPTPAQAIRQHKFVGLLEEPGSADLSARVDFNALRCLLSSPAPLLHSQYSTCC